MPNIEMILVRFNLDKEDDRRLFELLRKRCAPRKRNEFLKKALLQCLTEETGEKPGARPIKKQSKGSMQAELDVSRRAPAIAGAPQADTPEPKPVTDEPSMSIASEKVANTTDPDPEVAELIGSIVQ
jgi:hypothetical protein